jgi:hypothetical protein
MTSWRRETCDIFSVFSATPDAISAWDGCISMDRFILNHR